MIYDHKKGTQNAMLSMPINMGLLLKSKDKDYKRKTRVSPLRGNPILLIRLFSGCLGIRLQAIYFNMPIEFTDWTWIV